jgi:hypothetical protein
VSTFGDLFLLDRSTPAALASLLAPAGSPPPPRLLVLAGSVYDLANARLDRLVGVGVRDVVLQQPLFPVHRHAGTWTGVVPAYTRSELVVERRGGLSPLWVDIGATVVLTAVVELDPGGIDSVRTQEIEGFTSLEDFRARFGFIDLDDFMARHGLETVEDLREAYRYLKAEIRLRAPPTFDPDDPVNRLDVDVPVALLLRDTLDLTAALRDAKLLRSVAHDVLSPPVRRVFGEATAPCAPVLVFPRTALPPAGPTETAVHAFFAREGVLSVFADLP